MLARTLTREGIWEAIKARRCYATSGQRIALSVQADGHPMGSEFSVSGAPRIRVAAEGTADIEEIRVVRGLETVYTFPEEMLRDRRRIRVKWSGALIRGRARIARWDGKLRVEGAHIRAVEAFAFDSAAEYIASWDASHVAWKSVTSGDEDGLVLELDREPGARLHFDSEQTTFSVPLDQIGEDVHCVEVGGEELRVEIEFLPLGLAAKRAEFEWSDGDALPGCQPYYVRLTQVDGARGLEQPFLHSLRRVNQCERCKHVTHEAVHQAGGIGTVLRGLITASAYGEQVQRTLLIGPLGSADSDPLGADGVVLYDARSGIQTADLTALFSPIESQYGTRLVYGRRPMRFEDRSANVEVMLIDTERAPNGLDDFKYYLAHEFGIDSRRYEHEWEYEHYLRLSEPGYAVIDALCADESGACHILAHEFMGLGVAYKAILAGNPRYKTLFYAHEVATVRPLI